MHALESPQPRLVAFEELSIASLNKRALAIARCGTYQVTFERAGAAPVMHWSTEACHVLEFDAVRAPISLEQYAGFIHAEDRSRVVQRFGQALAEGANRWESEHRIVCPGGAIKWLREITERVPPNDAEPERLIGIVQDITERRNLIRVLDARNAELVDAERSLATALTLQATIVENASEGIVVYDCDLRYLAWNPFMAELTGIPAHAALGRGIFDIFPELRGSEIEASIQRALAGERVTTAEPVGRVKGRATALPVSKASRTEIHDLAIRWTLASYTPYRDAEGMIIGVIGVLYDLTDRVRNEDLQRQNIERVREFAAKEQADLEAERKRIAQALHDQLGQSLAALSMDLGAAKLLAPEHPEWQALVQRMETVRAQATAEMRRIIKALRPQLLDELGIAAAAEALLQESSQRTGISMRLTASADLDALTPAAQLVLYRILQESLTNVYKHSRARSLTVAITRVGAQVRMQVSDNGVGMDLAARTKRGSFGLLGMSERAAVLGGSVAIESAPGAGTTIEVTLPFQ